MQTASLGAHPFRLFLLAILIAVMSATRAAAQTVVINPSDDGDVFTNSVRTNEYILVAGGVRGGIEFPLAQVTGIERATLSINPYGLPLSGPVLQVAGYASTDGRLTAADYDAGIVLGEWTLPPLGFGDDAFFDVTEFLKTVTTPYVGFSLRSNGTDIFSSLEYNYGHPSQLTVVLPEPLSSLLLIAAILGLLRRSRRCT